MSTRSGAELLVDSLIAQGVEVIFGIPGAKIDTVFDVLQDRGPRLILCRHEQNAAFMAAIYGRLTGKPGVVLVTSGPGVSNLATGLLTATTEGDPVVAIGANVPRSMRYKQSHQGTDNVALMAPVCKQAVEVFSAQNISEVVDNSFRVSESSRRGATFISLPQDVLLEKTEVPVIKPCHEMAYGVAPMSNIQKVADAIMQAKQPVILFGLDASIPQNTAAIRSLLNKHPMACVGTYQAAGVISRDLLKCFVGRVGLFKNQPGDILLDEADLIITIGYGTVEYDPETWNNNNQRPIIHIDALPAKIHTAYQPQIELLGSVAENLSALSEKLPSSETIANQGHIEQLQNTLLEAIESGESISGDKIHPLYFIHVLKQCIDDETFVISDIGTHYMWLSRYLFSYQPHHLLFSNGQQTLGVAQPWALATSLLYPDKQIISVSGDGGFLFSAQVLETAVREKGNYVHCIWTDGSYDMVKQQQLMKYHRESHVEFGHIDVVKYAESFGATGFNVNNSNELKQTLEQAFNTQGPTLVNIPIDYSHNAKLFKTANEDVGH
jgi:acetolactate synthase-1/2/3 large subunit